MSGYPDKEGVEKVRTAIETIAHLNEEICKIDALIANRAKLVEQRDIHARNVPVILEKMDLTSRGNMGWEGRMIQFLTEFGIQNAEEMILRRPRT